jgi:hypothetical protein
MSAPPIRPKMRVSTPPSVNARMNTIGKALPKSGPSAPAPARALAPVLFRRRQRLAVDHADHPLDALVDAAREVAAPEPRHDDVLDDAVRDRVGHRAFEAVADLDPQRAIVLRDDEHRPVVDRPCVRASSPRRRAASTARSPPAPWSGR